MARRGGIIAVDVCEHAGWRVLGAERSSSVSISALDHRRSSHRRGAFRCWPTGSRWSASDSRTPAGEGTPNPVVLCEQAHIYVLPLGSTMSEVGLRLSRFRPRPNQPWPNHNSRARYAFHVCYNALALCAYCKSLLCSLWSNSFSLLILLPSTFCKIASNFRSI